MERADAEASKGRLVLATVKGDVHDIGKNLVDIILTNNGYEIHNLGIKVSISEMIDKALEVKADAIGMSGLLVKSTLIMKENLQELNARGLSEIPVMLGGAALTRSYVERDLREVYDGRVFYGKDAFEGLRVMDRLGELRRSGEDDPDFGRVPTGRILPPRRARSPRTASTCPAAPPRWPRTTPCSCRRSSAPRWSKASPSTRSLAYVNETALFRNQWQFRPEGGETDEAFKDRIRPTLRAELAKAREADLLVPQVVYGYFPVNADGHDLVVWKDDDRTAEWMRFSYPRQRRQPYLCISDFFRPVGSGERDYAAFHIVTHGRDGVRRAAELFAANRYQDYLLLHGLGVELAEALAEYWHARIRPSGASATRTAPACWACSARSSAAAATRGATPPAPTSRTTPRWPSCSTPTASAYLLARTPRGSTSPSRPPRRSSATTPRPSTSSPAERPTALRRRGRRTDRHHEHMSSRGSRSVLSRVMEDFAGQ